MLVKTALLVISNPNRLGKILPQIKQQVEKTLYIQVLNALCEPFGSFHPNLFASWPKFSNIIQGIYSQAAVHCENLDVRVLLSVLKYKTKSINTEKEVELVIFDEKYSSDEIQSFLSLRIPNINKEYKVITWDDIEADPVSVSSVKNEKTYQHTVLGGTFDRLHIAHKLLLSETALRSSSKVTIGVTEERMLKSKILWELIEPLEIRIKSVENFLRDICPELNISVEPIQDPFGPTQHDPTIDLLVVSSETLRGGEKVNEVRKEKGLPLLDLLPVDLIDNPDPRPYEEKKISSNTYRMRLLGTLLKPVNLNPKLPNHPYIIGLTGGIGSGKSSICQRLEKLGAHVIDCDKVGHGIYIKGKPCHLSIVKEFGERVLDEKGEINRKVLGSIVFGNPAELTKLNSLVWPAMAGEILAIIKKCPSRVIIIEAAVLLAAEWQKNCHEVWTCIIPTDEAIKRVMERNNLTEAQAKERVAAQLPNKAYIEASNVIFCTHWSEDFTSEQVNKAWSLLQSRLP